MTRNKKKKNRKPENGENDFSKRKKKMSHKLTPQSRRSDTEPQLPTGANCSKASKMTKRAKGQNRKMAVPKDSGRDIEAASNIVEHYDMVKSHHGLIERGFHRNVTSKTAADIESNWVEMAKRYMEKPSKDQFLAGVDGSHDSPNRYSRLERFTSAPLLFRQAAHTSRPVQGIRDDEEDNLLAVMINTIDVGGEIVNNIFAQGWNAVQNVAATSTTSWTALVDNSKIWDFCAASFRTKGASSVLMVVNPQCTIGELHMSNDLDPYGLDKKNYLSSWCKEAMKQEREIYLSIHLIHGRLASRKGRNNGKKGKGRANKLLPVEFLAPEILNVIRRIRHADRLWGSSQLVTSPPTGIFEPPIIFSASCLRRMMTQIFEHRAAFEVLHFHKVPLLDRRMIAIILRACPHVRMIGIYDCPMVHFGDVICLLDLINEVNENRRKQSLPEVTAFDFYPRYNEGMPYASDNSATYGLTWGPHPLDVVQRGFFFIILKAFMKTNRMKIDLLFSKDKAFCKYLCKVPNYPLAVPTFLDALNRYIEIKPKGKAAENQRKQVVFDLLKPVRLGVEANVQDSCMQWYCHTMGQNLLFCSSCGYETLEEFFSAIARNMRPHRRVCAGCILQRWLDEEADHLKTFKTQTLHTLCPEWKGTEFNNDAPILQSARHILWLKSTVSERPSVQATGINGSGEMYTRRYLLDLLRDNKVHWDSLQNLPTLSDLISGSDSVAAWGNFYNRCNNLDVFCRSVRRVRQERELGLGKQNLWIDSRTDGGMPDHADETQPPKRNDGVVPCHDFESAIMLYAGLIVKGWVGTS